MTEDEAQVYADVQCCGPEATFGPSRFREALQLGGLGRIQYAFNLRDGAEVLT